MCDLFSCTCTCICKSMALIENMKIPTFMYHRNMNMVIIKYIKTMFNWLGGSRRVIVIILTNSVECKLVFSIVQNSWFLFSPRKMEITAVNFFMSFQFVPFYEFFCRSQVLKRCGYVFLFLSLSIFGWWICS